MPRSAAQFFAAARYRAFRTSASVRSSLRTAATPSPVLLVRADDDRPITASPGRQRLPDVPGHLRLTRRCAVRDELGLSVVAPREEAVCRDAGDVLWQPGGGRDEEADADADA